MEKVALITGCSSGFGLLSTIELAHAGFRVIATMRDLARRTYLDEAIAVAHLQDKVSVRQLDVTQQDTHTEFIRQVVAEFGRVDVLVNNAGFALGGFAEDVSLAELRRQLETNFFGAVSLTKAVLPTMRAQRSGRIIMMSSISGRLASPGLSSYAASKFALEGYTESLRLEMSPLGIYPILIEPGAFETGIWYRDERIAAAARDPKSPNYERTMKFRDYVDQKVSKRDPRAVARLVARVATIPRPKLRYLIGTDARVFHGVSRWLPWRLYELLVTRAGRSKA